MKRLNARPGSDRHFKEFIYLLVHLRFLRRLATGKRGGPIYPLPAAGPLHYMRRFLAQEFRTIVVLRRRSPRKRGFSGRCHTARRKK